MPTHRVGGVQNPFGRVKKHCRHIYDALDRIQEICYTDYSDDIRTSKTVNGTEYVYTLNGSQIVSEAWGDYLLIYLYDESGSPIRIQKYSVEKTTKSDIFTN